MSLRHLWIILFCLLLAGLAAGPQLLSRKPGAEEKLCVVSPHWDGIRKEFGRAFEAAYRRETGRTIEVVWLDAGGTGEMIKYLTQRMEGVKPEQGIGIDIMFGGGMDKLPRMAESRFFEPFPLSPEQQQQLPASASDQPLRDERFRYHAACLSTFGLVYNTLVLEKARLPVPASWDDAGAPEFYGWVSCGDPTTSGSLHQVFELVLQGQGWERGYRTLVRLISNTRAPNEGGTSIPRDVSLGQAAAGPCIDFYATAPIRRQGAAHLKLLVPPGFVVATPDCIAILRGPPNRKAAFAFMNFVLSEAGQRLWYQTRGTEGGPVEYDLERLPVMPAIYERGYATNTVANPFKTGGDFKYDSRKGGQRWSILNDLWRATLLDTHGALTRARQAVIQASRESDLGAVLARAPLGENDLLKLAQRTLTADQRNALRNNWVAWARNWYAAVENAARQNGPAPAFVPAPLE